MSDLYPEIKFKTARSGGPGGQNVNKVETMVEGYWSIESSAFFTQEEKAIIIKKLANKINSAGFLLVKSQVERTQLANKELVVKKINLLVSRAMVVEKKRKATKPNKAAKEKRMDNKKKAGEIKRSRKKVKENE